MDCFLYIYSVKPYFVVDWCGQVSFGGAVVMRTLTHSLPWAASLVLLTLIVSTIQKPIDEWAIISAISLCIRRAGASPLIPDAPLSLFRHTLQLRSYNTQLCPHPHRRNSSDIWRHWFYASFFPFRSIYLRAVHGATTLSSAFLCSWSPACYPVLQC